MTPETSSLQVNVFDGTRNQIKGYKKFLVTITDGFNKQLVRNYYNSGETFSIPFYDNLGDSYTVLVYSDEYGQAGFTPISCSPQHLQQVDIMLLGSKTSFNFAAAKWRSLETSNPLLFQILSKGATDNAAEDRYSQVMEKRPATLACLFNIATAMTEINLPVGNPLEYFKELIWDDSMATDRFYGYADPALYDQVKQSTVQARPVFVREPGFAIFHTGATDSYKQIQFGEANLQLTFHANDTRVINGLECIKMEPDIDYYRDLAAHALLEVISNGISGSLTDPRQVYVLKWIAGRHAGVPDFSPPYVIV